MNIRRKTELAEQAIRSITTHDDAPQDEVLAVGRHLKEMIDQELDRAVARRHQKMLDARKAQAENN